MAAVRWAEIQPGTTIRHMGIAGLSPLAPTNRLLSRPTRLVSVALSFDRRHPARPRVRRHRSRASSTPSRTNPAHSTCEAISATSTSPEPEGSTGAAA
jgi:hypothetical protein